MSKITLFKPQALDCPDGFQWDSPSTALERWAHAPMAAEADDPNTISIYDVIGEDPWTGGGVTSQRIAAALRSIGPNDVTVNVNSPGGSVFEGLAIYNLLAEHPASINVRVMGVAASAASIIAMAGDTIEMGLGSFLMVHNSWGVVIGNKTDMRDAADIFAQFDGALADIYAHRTGNDRAEIETLMDGETWISAKDAVAQNFATGTFAAPKHTDDDLQAQSGLSAKRQLDALLAKQGMPRSERRKLLKEAAGTHDAAGTNTPSAVEFDAELAASFLSTLRS
ncbi:MAG: head maturation protease, ClpP-related [Pseudomonadota bacterium]